MENASAWPAPAWPGPAVPAPGDQEGTFGPPPPPQFPPPPPGAGRHKPRRAIFVGLVVALIARWA